MTWSEEPEFRPIVSVVLCARNASATIGRQLAALAAQDFTGPWELVVVDNASTDDTSSVARGCSRDEPTWQVVAEPRVGVNQARNTGVTATRAPLVVHCDADDEVEPAWLGSMVAALEAADVVGGRLADDPHAETSTHWRNEVQRDRLPSFLGRPYSFGASLGYRREVFDRLGGFDTGFRHGGNDVEFCIRAGDAGYTFGFAAGAVVRYRPRPTRRLLVRQQFRYGRGHQDLVMRRRFTGVSPSLPGRAGALLDAWVRTPRLVTRLARPEGRDALLVRVSYLSGQTTELVARAGRRQDPASPPPGGG